MARVLGEMIEVKPQCAFQWARLLHFAEHAAFAREAMNYKVWDDAWAHSAFLFTSPRELHSLEYGQLDAAIKARDAVAAIVALKDWTLKASDGLVRAVVECECVHRMKAIDIALPSP